MVACTLALAQDAPFTEEQPSPWQPRWELTARGERIAGILGDHRAPLGDIERAGVQVRLRWEIDWLGLDWYVGTRSALASDGNVNNVPRWDQQPSNGTRLDVARVDLSGLSEHAFGHLRLGFQELELIAPQAMWDPDLRFLGASASGGLRGGVVQEASLRGAAGRVRTVYPGEDLDLAAFQAVLKLGFGAVDLVFHVDRWALGWDADEGRFQSLNFIDEGRQRLVLDGLGGSARWEGPLLPLEVRWSGYRETRTRDSSEEFQVVAGNRVRPFRPQASFTWQRLSSTGELYPLNGDQWWYYRGAKGPRWDLALPLPGRWSIALAYLRQSLKGVTMVAEKTMLTVARSF